MNTILDLKVNENASQAYEKKSYTTANVLLMLMSRVMLFLIFQLLFYFGLSIAGDSHAWTSSASWWPFSVILTNLVGVYLIHRLLKRESKRFIDFFTFDRKSIKKDILLAIILFLIANAIAYIFNFALGSILFGDFSKTFSLFYRPLPLWAALITLLLFPLTMPLGELTTYFGYVMPRLELITKNKLLSLMLPVFFLSVQHAALPLLFDARFIVWRAFMFLPLALFMGLVIKRMPRLLPYLLIGHILIDIMNSFMILAASMK